MNSTPEILLNKLYLTIYKIIKNSNFHKEKIASAVKNLSDIFNSPNRQINNYYMQNDVLRIAYLAYFYPINVYKCLHIINFYRDFFINKKIYFDYGAGPLTFFTACALQKIEGDRFFAFDKNPDILQLGKSVIKDISIKMHERLIFSLPDNNTNVIFLGNILSELEQKEMSNIFKQLLKIVDPKDNIIIILEPGTKKGFNNIKHVRNILNEYDFKFLNPCPVENCPMEEKDWCHENLIFPRSELIKYIEQKTGLNNKFINFTYSIFSTKVKKIIDFDENTFKVVSNLLDRKGEYAVYLCGRMGLQIFSILKKHLNESNTEFTNFRRGDIVYIKNFKKISNFYRLDRNSVIKIIKKFDCSNFS